MSFISTIFALISGATCSFAYASIYPEDATWWQILLIAIVPGLVSNGIEFLIYLAKKNNWIDKEDADKLIERKHQKEDEEKKENEEIKEEK